MVLLLSISEMASKKFEHQNKEKMIVTDYTDRSLLHAHTVQEVSP